MCDADQMGRFDWEWNEMMSWVWTAVVLYYLYASHSMDEKKLIDIPTSNFVTCSSCAPSHSGAHLASQLVSQYTDLVLISQARFTHWPCWTAQCLTVRGLGVVGVIYRYTGSCRYCTVFTPPSRSIKLALHSYPVPSWSRGIWGTPNNGYRRPVPLPSDISY